MRAVTWTQRRVGWTRPGVKCVHVLPDLFIHRHSFSLHKLQYIRMVSNRFNCGRGKNASGLRCSLAEPAPFPMKCCAQSCALKSLSISRNHEL